MVQLVARDDERERALALLRDVGRVVVVGPGGIGKTSLALELAGRLADEHLVVEADRLARSGAIESLVVDLVAGPRPGADDADALAGGTRGRHLVLVLDGADTIVDDVLVLADAVPVKQQGPWVIVTSRVQPGPTDWPVLRLGPLAVGGTTSPATALFRARYRTAGGDSDLLAGASDRLVRVVDETAGVPLAIEVAAARAAVLGFPDHDGEPGTPEPDEVVARSLARSLDALPDEAVDLFVVLGVTSGRFSVPLAAALVDLPGNGTLELLELLARHSLLQATVDGFAMLPPIHREAARRAATHAGDAHRRHGRWCLDRARTPQTAVQAQSVVVIDLDLRLAIDRSLLAGEVTAACTIARALDDAYRLTVQHRRRVELLDTTLGRLSDAPGAARPRAELLRRLALAHADTDGPSTARTWLDQADAALGPVADDDVLALDIRRNRAACEAVAGDPRGAVDTLLEVADLSARRGDLEDELHARHYAANALLELGRLDDADSQASLVVARAGAAFPGLQQLGLDSRAMVALERGDRATCEAIGRRLAAAASDDGRRLDGEYLMLVSDPATHAHRPAWALSSRDHDDATADEILGELGRAICLLVTGDASRALAVATDVAVAAEGWEVVWATLDALLLAGDAAACADDAVQAGLCHRHALVVAADHGYVLRVADALDGLARAGSDPGAQRAAVTAATLRRSHGAVPRPRPWLPVRRQASASPVFAPPPGWIVDGHLTVDGLRHFVSDDPDPASQPLDALSPAERRVVALVVEGCTNREIGERLHIGRRTVETHLLHAFQKLDVANRTQLAMVAATAGAG